MTACSAFLSCIRDKTPFVSLMLQPLAFGVDVPGDIPRHVQFAISRQSGPFSPLAVIGTWHSIFRRQQTPRPDIGLTSSRAGDQAWLESFVAGRDISRRQRL